MFAQRWAGLEARQSFPSEAQKMTLIKEPRLKE